MKVVTIIQARVGSTRLPGKVLERLADDTVLGQTVRRARATPGVHEVVVATTVGVGDDAVEAEARRLGCACFRGSEEDVLSRYLGAARQAGADIVVRVTSDCPLLDPALSGQVVAALVEGVRSGQPRPDYAANIVRRTLPRGLDTEAVTRETLERVGDLARAPREREHVTLFINEHPERFVRLSVEFPEDWSRFRLTVDTADDLRLVREIYTRLGGAGPIFPTRAVVDLLNAEPALAAINAHVEQKVA